jgi:signal transduction histidine kinase
LVLFFLLAVQVQIILASDSKADYAALFYLGSPPVKPIELKKYLKAFEDSTRKLNIFQVASPGFNLRFHENKFERKPWQNQSYVIWARLQIKNISGAKQRIFLSGTFGDTVICYKQQGINQFDSRMTGKRIPLVNRGKTLIPHCNFDYIIDTNEIQTFYFRLSQDNYEWLPREIPLQLDTMTSIANVQKKLRINLLLNGIYFGMALFMALYALALLFIFREKAYLWLALFQISNFLFFLDQSGVGFHFLYPDNTFLFKYGNTLLLWAIVVWHFMFIACYLEIRKMFPKIYAGLVSLMLLTALSRFIFWPFGLFQFGKYLEDFGFLVLFMLFFSLIIYMAVGLKIRQAKFMILAEMSIFITGTIMALVLTHIIDFQTRYAINLLQAGMAVQMLLWTIAIVDKITMLRSEKDLSRARELDMALANELLIRDQNVMLEQKVEERTHELMEAQSHLIQSEKMASLGILTAGIAHEINSPVNFISAGATRLQKDYEDLQQIIQSIDQLPADTQKLADKLGMNELLENIPQTINDIKTGVQRTSEIVKGLRNFTRLDASEFKDADLHEGLDSTLLLLSHKIKDRIKIVKEYDKRIGFIKCFPGPLNQVFMNLINNAIDAIEQKVKEISSGGDSDQIMNSVGEYRIGIETRLMPEGEKKQVKIVISDNGTGIPAEIRDKLFDPFFTTKEIGKGTGLGLSICHGIIEKHGGTITFDSKINVGSSFTINLPV